MSAFNGHIKILFLLVLLQISAGAKDAYALSASCTTLSSLSTTSYSGNFPASTFASGESVTVSFADDGGDPASLPMSATDHVRVQDAAQSNAYKYNYDSSSRVSGLHTNTVTSAQLNATGLNLIISTGTHIGAVTISCSAGGSAPTVANTSTTVPANSSNNTLALSITGTVTTVAVASGPTHGTASISGTDILYSPTAGYSGPDSLTYTASNTNGTSTTATASITVTALPLSLSPAAGTIASGTQGTAYSQIFTAAGGTGPYTYALTGVLPTGLSFNAGTATLSGTPTASGSYSITVTVTDATSSTTSAAYSFTIAASGSGSVPVAVNQIATVAAGQTVVINLANGATGNPYTGAALVTAPAASQGTATIANTYYLTFVAASQASGTLALQYTLSNASGTSNTATVTVQITGRPDPSKDQQVIGLVSAQAQSAVQFANAQLSNFNNRLEHLHKEGDRRSKLFNISVSLPRNAHDQDDQLNTQADKRRSGVATRDDPANNDGQRWITDPNLAIWTGGYINFLTSNRDSLRLDHTTIGISAGADYRFAPDFVAGLGIGFGHDVSDIASSGTQNKGNAASAALYASYHPGQVFVDSLLGYSYLNFDSHRYITDTGGSANGSRNGQQFFGTISSGYEFQLQNLMLSPYGRMQFSSTLLRNYTESGGGVYNLSYANQRINTLAAIAGLRSQYGIPMSWGALRLTGRLEYSHSLKGDSVARMGYADVGNDTYAVTVLGLDQNTVSASAGVEFLLRGGWTLGLTYQGTTSMDSSTHENAVLLRAVYKY